MAIKNVLIVDDIVMNRILLTEILQQGGYKFETAVNGKDAISKLEKQSFDIVLMDIEMPVMNGIETTRYIRKNFPPVKNTIPIIAITAHDPSSFFEDFEGVGFNELITKPYSLAKIASIFTLFAEFE
jgi:two-component system, response regulator, stage 0 sporulation protein F